MQNSSLICCTHTHTCSLTHTHPHTHHLQKEERGDSISRQVLEKKKKKKKKKRSLAVPFPLTHRRARSKHTGTLSSLLAIHIILSLCPLREYTNFTTSPSSQPICSKIVVEREGKKGRTVQIETKSRP